MKKFITLVFMVIASTISAQWSNTTNQFYDSLHMPVSTALQSQKNPIVLTSYPDGGYFVIWEDDRNMATTKTDIYAQKYNAAGNRLWAENGIPVANGPNTQRFTFSSNQDYRNRSFAATDSAGGFYLGYIDDSITSYSWERIAAQHILSNGTMVYPGKGYIVAYTPSNDFYTLSAPKLIADGNKGFYIAYSKNYGGQNHIYAYNFKDEGGTMKYYGGGWLNENAIQRSEIAPCGLRTYLQYPSITVSDFNIWSDGQGGCNVVMNAYGGSAGQGAMVIFNRLWRAKKNATVRTYKRNTSGAACPFIKNYIKDQAYILYTFSKDEIITTCGNGATAYVQTSERLLANGYMVIDQGGYDYNYPKGVTALKIGNINVDVFAVTKRTNINNVVSGFSVFAYNYRAEIYDSVPFQRASYGNPDIGFNPIVPQMDELDHFRDTILGTGNYYPDFSLACSDSQIYAAGLFSTSGSRWVRLQHLAIERKDASTFGFVYQTSSKLGEAIGREQNTGFAGTDINYDHPLITVNNTGNAIFYIREYGRGPRISPIFTRAELGWGAMGVPIGTGVYNGNYYNADQPVFALSNAAGIGAMAWTDNRNISGTGENIFMRQISRLNERFLYRPPFKMVRSMPNPYGGTLANPAVLLGSSNHFSTIEVYNTYGSNPGTSPVAEIMDSLNLGSISALVYQNNGPIRKYNNQPYLDRNYTFRSETIPPGAIIRMRLFFTKDEFLKLKGADNSITNPGDLIVAKQPFSTFNVPTTYTPVAGERLITPIAWDTLAGGYFIDFRTNDFGNFFIQKTAIAGTCPGGSVTISSSLTGVAYQWKLNIGGTFVNVVNNANYAGATTPTLQINNIPSAWAGNQYLCFVDGANSSVTTLRIVNTWNGSVNNNWGNAGNWSCGTVPDANTDVILNGGTIVVNSNATCRTITINPGVNITLNPGVTLTVLN